MFKTQVSGKWVLSGEHAVLRGYGAVALPYPQVSLTLEFDPNTTGELSFSKKMTEEGVRLVKELLEALNDRYADLSRRLSGELTISSTIPIGAGLGSSAALCVALTRWLSDPLKLQSQDFFEFARQLEHRFHGRSSGMDIAVLLNECPVFFSLEGGAKPLKFQELPHFTLHDTGIRTRTTTCVAQVDEFQEDHPVLAQQTLERMGKASRAALEGLTLYSGGKKPQGLGQLTQALNDAQECFYTWQLVPGAARRLERDLRAQGALAVKLTGAGGGGMLVALWEKNQ